MKQKAIRFPMKKSQVWERKCNLTGNRLQYAITEKGTVARRFWIPSVLRINGAVGNFSAWNYGVLSRVPEFAVLTSETTRVRSDI